MGEVKIPTVGKNVELTSEKKEARKDVALVFNAGNALILTDVNESSLKVNPKLVPIKNRPSNKCKACYGRGHVGFNKLKAFYIPCRCMDPYRLKGSK